ncbi:MAG: HAD-IIA family hydrolase [Thermosipho sp. (in: Bacteria)]|nr:HAD-IIA family hydrolase [Thermosipho sp. (in: thermotogales)]
MRKFIQQKKKHLKDILLRKYIFVFDKDGTLSYDFRPIPGAKDFLEYLIKNDKKVVILTNNSSIPNGKHLEMINKIFNLEFSIENIYSSLDHLGYYLKKNNISKVYPLLNKESLNYLKTIHYVEEEYNNPEFVLVGFHTEGKYKDWAHASLLIQKGIPYIIVNPDLRCPTDKGFIPDAGSISKMLELTTGIKASHICGKPNPEILKLLLEKFGKSKDEIVYFGDRLYTDIEMGIKCGITTILMLTGETKFEEVPENIVKAQNLFIIESYFELMNILK